MATRIPIRAVLGPTAHCSRNILEPLPCPGYFRRDKTERLLRCGSSNLQHSANHVLLHGARGQWSLQVEGADLVAGRRLQYAEDASVDAILSQARQYR